MALALLRALLAKGQHARLFCLDAKRSMAIPGDPDEQVAINNAIITLSKGSPKDSTLKKAFSFPKLLYRLERQIRRNKLDIVISFMERANLLNLMGSSAIPRIISVRKHLSMGLKDKSPLKRLLVRVGYSALLKRASNINFNSQEAASDFQNLFPQQKKPLSVIYNFVDEDMAENGELSPGKEAEGLLNETSIVTCGRLMPVKGQLALMRAFTEVSARSTNARLIILGDGPLRNQLHEYRRLLKLENQVILAGFQCNPFAWVKRSALFVLSSRAEGFPNALLEAMALGKAVISTDCHSGPRELLAPGSDSAQKTLQMELAPFGILTPPLQRQDLPATSPLSQAESALAEAMNLLLNDSHLRQKYANKARERASAFERDPIITQWYELLTEQLKEKES